MTTFLTVRAIVTDVCPATIPARPRPRAAALLPIVLLGAPALFVVHHYGTPARALLLFGAYVVALIAAPGVLLWRATRRRAGTLAEDIGPGLGVGYALEILGYLAARAVGLPLAVVLPPLAVLVLFAAVPALRRYWRSDAHADRAPLGWIWANSAIVTAVVVWAGLFFMRKVGPDYAFNDGDMPFQLALIGELKHHVPPQVPWVQGEPLSYHWFSYAHMAAASWITGIEPTLVLLRLFYLPLIAALPFALGALARRLTGLWWPGPVGAAIALFCTAPYPYGWPMPSTYARNGLGPVDDGVILRAGLFFSPTQTFAATLGVGLVLLLVELLRGDVRGRGGWALLAAFVAVTSGAKATYLPLVLCGLLLVVGVTLVARRRWHRPALLCTAVVVPGVLFAQLVLFHGATQGMMIDPLGGLGRYGLGGSTGLGALKFGQIPTTGAALAAITAITLLAWAMMWGGVGGFLAGGRWRDPAYLLLLGVGAAALSTVLLLNHYGFSQTWFLVAARPYLGVLAAAGLAALAAAGRVRAGWLALAAVAGAGAARVVQLLGPDAAPTVATVGRRAVLVAITTPNVALLAVAAVVGAVVALRWRRAVPAVVLALLAGFAVTPTVGFLGGHVRQAAAAGFEKEPTIESQWPEGTRRAARWLREHSAPDDLIATNGHCRPRPGACDNLHFVFSAFAERRFLVEGWGYTASVNRIQAQTGLAGNIIPYWDPPRLAANDAAFHRPSAATVGRLRRDYGVRWLFVEETDAAVRTDQLDRVARLRYRTGKIAVYELTDAPPEATGDVRRAGRPSRLRSNQVQTP